MEDNMTHYKPIWTPILVVSIILTLILTSCTTNKSSPDNGYNPCIVSSGFSCSGEPVITNYDVTFNITNDMGFELTLPLISNSFESITNTLNCTLIYFCSEGNIICRNNSITIGDGFNTTIRLENCDISNQNVVTGDIRIMYKNPQSNLPEILSVSIVGKVINYSRQIPDTCLASIGFGCLGRPAITNNNIIFTINNKIRDNITLSDANVNIHFRDDSTSYCKGIYFCNKGVMCKDTYHTLEYGDDATLILHDCDFNDQTLVRSDINIPYTNSSNLPEKLTIQIVGRIQE
jgi:hypothetical protein